MKTFLFYFGLSIKIFRCNLHFTLYNPHITLKCIIHTFIFNTLKNPHFKAWIMQFEVYDLYFVVYNRHFEVFSVRFEVWIIHFKVLIIQFEV